LSSTLKDYTKEEREDVQIDINRSFDDNINRPDYARKLYLIERCIYGVDIQSIAVQISKLRFFISLVVDQCPTHSPEDNFGIRPLPNLEAKFVAANTLIGLSKTKTLFDSPEVEKLQEKLNQTNHRIFGAKSNKAKNKYKARVEELQIQIAEKLEELGVVGNDDARLMQQWKMFDQNASSPFFDPEWMFGLKSGASNQDGYFDIVIGNPPYLKEGRVSKTIFEGLKHSPYYQGKMDLWYMFTCVGIDLLSKNGTLCFIATNNWVTSGGASKLRNKVVGDSKIIQLVDFGNFMIFESASIQTMIMLFSKDNSIDNYTFDYRKLNGNTILADTLDLLSKKANNKAIYLSPIIIRGNFKDSYLTFNSNDFILEKISSTALYLTGKEVANGIHPHYDFVNNKLATLHNLRNGEGIFGLSETEKINLNLLQNECRFVKPYYTTEQIHRYYSNPNNSLWLIYTDSKFKNPNSMNNYPNLKKHLDRFSNVITSDNRPYGLHRAREERFFKGEKILALRKCVGTPSFSYSDFDCYVSATFYVIKTDRVNLKYLTGLLNSRLIAFWLKNKGKMQGDNYQLDKEPLLQIPIRVGNEYQVKSIIRFVEQIISLKEINPNEDICNIEKEIDNIIYDIYNLTEDEIEIIINN